MVANVNENKKSAKENPTKESFKEICRILNKRRPYSCS